jgi:hypothetical protein
MNHSRQSHGCQHFFHSCVIEETASSLHALDAEVSENTLEAIPDELRHYKMPLKHPNYKSRSHNFSSLSSFMTAIEGPAAQPFDEVNKAG